jgi:hypothetical protein
MLLQIRQGDLLLVQRPTPASATRVESLGLRLPGERSGHEHLLAAEVYDTPQGRLLQLREPTELVTVHTDTGERWDDRHQPRTIPAGWWEPIPQRQYVPSGRPVRRGRFD